MASGTYRGRYGQGQAPQGIGAGPIFAVGIILLAVGAFVVMHALAGGDKLPPAAAQQIPSTVSTAVPFPPNPSTVAPPLAGSTPVEIEIPKLGVKAPIVRLGLNSDGTIQVPPLNDHNLAGWYGGTVTPGQTGSSVIIGHVDSYAGPSVFFSIKNLVKGDEVDVVRADGTTAAFSVDGVQKAEKTLFPTSEVYGNVPYPALRLVTCGGPFDAARGSYLDNIVVYAHLSGVVPG
jgi:sortase (surface protein transpeptidase)